MAKPKITTNCVANQYTIDRERIVEFSDSSVRSPDGPTGGLISFRRSPEDHRLTVSVYRCEPEVDVVVSRPDRDDLSWSAHRAAIDLAEEGLRRLLLWSGVEENQLALMTPVLRRLRERVENEMVCFECGAADGDDGHPDNGCPLSAKNDSFVPARVFETAT